MSGTDSRHPVSARAAATHELETVSFGPFSLRTRLLEKDGAPVKLGGRATDILRLLLSRAGEVIPKEEILAYAWAGLVVEEISLQRSPRRFRCRTGWSGWSEGRIPSRICRRGC